MNRKLTLILTFLAAMAAGRGMAAVAANSVAATNAPVVKDAPAVKETPAKTAAPAASSSGKLDYDSFKLVWQRNIFDMSRTGRIGVKPPPPRVVVDDFTLLGTINSGPYAIFEGSSSEYEKNVKAGDKIGGFNVSAIGSGYVDLVSTNGKTIRMGLSTTMRREDRGPWKGPTMRDDTILADSSSSSSRDTADRSDRGDRSSRSDRSDRRLYRNSRSDRSGGSNSAAGTGDAGPGASTPDSKSDNSASSNESDIIKRLMEKRAQQTKDN